MNDVVVSGGRTEAMLYAAVHGGTPGDVEHYVRMCAGARAVLELGCGAGRVLAGVLDADVRQLPRVVGVDKHPGMVELAGEAIEGAGDALQGDMTDFDLELSFDRVLIPYSGFWCLGSQDKRRCLECIRRHLSPGGELHFDVYDADELVEEAAFQPPGCQPDEFELVLELDVDGDQLEVFEQNQHWFDEQRMLAVFEYRQVPSGQVVSRQCIEHCYLSRAQLAELLVHAGFESPRRIADHDGQLFFSTCALA